MKTRTDYYQLVNDLQAVERRLTDAMNGVWVYLTDENVDIENLPEGVTDASPEYWDAMHRCACGAAGGRAEDAGIDLHKELGRVIY
jgi:hypothetical protein